MASYAVVMENLKERSKFMNESMQKSQTITDNMISILGSFDHRLSALETAMRPTQVFISSSEFPLHKCDLFCISINCSLFLMRKDKDAFD